MSEFSEILETAAEISKRLREVADNLNSVATSLESIGQGQFAPGLREASEQYRGAAKLWELMVLKHSLGAGGGDGLA